MPGLGLVVALLTLLVDVEELDVQSGFDLLVDLGIHVVHAQLFLFDHLLDLGGEVVLHALAGQALVKHLDGVVLQIKGFTSTMAV